jgi:hypothetical protein
MTVGQITTQGAPARRAAATAFSNTAFIGFEIDEGWIRPMGRSPFITSNWLA